MAVHDAMRFVDCEVATVVLGLLATDPGPSP
jgi:ATP-dependent protease ClpP protease subunit